MEERKEGKKHLTFMMNFNLVIKGERELLVCFVLNWRSFKTREKDPGGL